jgi:hypothetical protein
MNDSQAAYVVPLEPASPGSEGRFPSLTPFPADGGFLRTESDRDDRQAEVGETFFLALDFVLYAAK